MRKPNTALRLMARALDAQKKAGLSKDKEVRAYYLGKARKAIDLAAKAKDSGKAISIIEASNKYAKIMAEEIDDVDVSDEDGDIEVDTDEEEIDADGLDEDLDDEDGEDDGIDPEEVLKGSDEGDDIEDLDDEDLDDELDADDMGEDEEDLDDDLGEDDDVDTDEEIAARVARILSRKKTRR